MKNKKIKKQEKVNKKTNSKEWKPFDDCSICDAMKDGIANSLEGLKSAFKKAEKKNSQNNSVGETVQGLRMAMREPNKNDLYYDAMELLESGDLDDAKDAEKLLEQALKMDEHSVQTHIGFVHVYGALGNKDKAESYIKKAYEETVRKFPKWPKKMAWGYLENREYLRAIQYRADIYADEGEREKAIELYRLLLKLNPNDNQGVRFVLAGIYADVSGLEINKMTDDGNKKQNWSKLDNLLKKQNAKHKFWKEPRE